MTALDPRVFVRFVDQFVGGDYGFCDRCGGTCYDRQHDCSGLQCHGSNGTGLTRGVCTTSFVIASQCWNLGRFMDQATAEADSGPDIFWAFHGANFGRTDDGSRPNGASGHIVLVVRVRDANGHTIGFYTIEAMGRAYGIVRGVYSGRNPAWSGRYRIPGVADRSVPPPKPKRPPVYSPPYDIPPWVDYLDRPGGGIWFLHDNGYITYVGRGQPPVLTGMDSPKDRKDWGDRHAASIEARGDGYRILATDGGPGYVPEGQH